MKKPRGKSRVRVSKEPVRIWTVLLEEFDNYIRGVNLPSKDCLSVVADIVDPLIVTQQGTFMVSRQMTSTEERKMGPLSCFPLFMTRLYSLDVLLGDVIGEM